MVLSEDWPPSTNLAEKTSRLQKRPFWGNDCDNFKFRNKFVSHDSESLSPRVVSQQ